MLPHKLCQFRPSATNVVRYRSYMYRHITPEHIRAEQSLIWQEERFNRMKKEFKQLMNERMGRYFTILKENNESNIKRELNSLQSQVQQTDAYRVMEYQHMKRELAALRALQKSKRVGQNTKPWEIKLPKF